ncbi:MAG: hypothetical protein ACFFDT_06215 [Candidatus Hodarchaeota archaeon]
MHSKDGEEDKSVSSPHSLVGVFLICLFLLSGCLVSETVYYGIDVELLSEDEIAALLHPFLNITHLNFTEYPTLYQAITFLIDPSTNESSVLLDTPQEEWNRIQSLIEDSYFTYFHFYFSIGYVIS